MSHSNDPAFLIRTAHVYDRRLSVPAMAARLDALVVKDTITYTRHEMLVHHLNRTPVLNPMTHVAALLAQDVRFLDMKHLYGYFDATVLGDIVCEPCGCIAGHTLELFKFIRRGPSTGKRSPVEDLLISNEWELFSDTLLAASGHTCAAAGVIDYFASDLDGRRQVIAMATLEAKAANKGSCTQ